MTVRFSGCSCWVLRPDSRPYWPCWQCSAADAAPTPGARPRPTARLRRRPPLRSRQLRPPSDRSGASSSLPARSPLRNKPMSRRRSRGVLSPRPSNEARAWPPARTSCASRRREVGAQAQEAEANARQIEARLAIADGGEFRIDRVPEVASARAAAELAQADFDRARCSSTGSFSRRPTSTGAARRRKRPGDNTRPPAIRPNSSISRSWPRARRMVARA